MQLKEFSLISPTIESGTVLKALKTAIPTEAIEKAISLWQQIKEIFWYYITPKWFD